MKDFTTNSITGALGLLRVLIPKILLFDLLETQVIHKIIEIYEICLHLLNDSNHSIINASLECMCVILNNSPPKLTEYLVCTKLKHMEILCKKRSLKNQIFRRKSSTTSTEQGKSKNQLHSSPGIPSKSDHSGALKDDDDIKNALLDASVVSTDDKALLTGSDLETDSFKANDTESEKNYDSSSTQSPVRISKTKSTSDMVLLKSQKSTDSIGSFFDKILTHPNTGGF